MPRCSGRKAAAFSTPWKFKIGRLRRGDHVFLYRSGIGVIAVGTADGKLRTAPYHGQKDEEYVMGLLDFGLVDPPLTAAEVKTVTSNPGLVFRQTMFSLDREGGAKLSQAARARAGKG